MDLVRHLLVLVHLIGFAALFGGCVVQIRTPRPEVNGAMLVGAITQLVSGIALVVIDELTPPAGDVDVAEVVVKLVISVVITVLVVANRRFSSVPKGLWALMFGLSFVNAAVAVLWGRSG